VISRGKATERIGFAGSIVPVDDVVMFNKRFHDCIVDGDLRKDVEGRFGLSSCRVPANDIVRFSRKTPPLCLCW
jgi:hypothetical protein